jgi:hypothetical protein
VNEVLLFLFFVFDKRGVTVDIEGFDIEMENQRKQSQAAHNVVKLSVEIETEIVPVLNFWDMTLLLPLLKVSLILNFLIYFGCLICATRYHRSVSTGNILVFSSSQLGNLLALIFIITLN